jgi:cyclic beta-1,2-glucan synthetase
VTAPVAEPPLAALEAAARELCASHTGFQARPDPLPVLEHLAEIRLWLERARDLLADPDPESAKAAEWVLDNDYLIERALRQIGEDLPPGFYRQLGGLTHGDHKGLPRAFALAHALLRASHMHVSLAGAVTFVQAYQATGAWLTIAELWALPALLRLACLELLVISLTRLMPALEPPFRATPLAVGFVEETECIARSLVNLRLISSIPWKAFFDQTSRVEEILRRDPAGVYGGMDFDTRDRYRATVEAFARWSGGTEIDVAERAVIYASAFEKEREAEAHVGHWLIGDGRRAFERAIACELPARVSVARWCLRHAGLLYAAALVAATVATLAVPGLYLATAGTSVRGWLLAIGVAALPASVVAVTVVQWLVTLVVPPRVLPKLDFVKGIPPEYATAVVVPALVSSPHEARELIARLEEHCLANPDPGIRWALLTDPVDAPAETLPIDERIEQTLVGGIRELNDRYGHDRRPFHVLHRHRRFNPAEGYWMAWERKRGKLEEFNRLIGDSAAADAFALHEGEGSALRQIRFVVTVDADTRLPPGTVARLAGTLAHPLNRPAFETTTGRVRSGYTVVQPRVEIAPESGSRSAFARLYSGDTAIDIYSRAVSDVYQDLFGTGIYVGKGIYDVEAFTRSLAGRVPENALASHDLFEGVHGRAALASDIVLYENFPSQYESFARRWHRWIRGDWQLLPWLARSVPGPGSNRLPNRLSVLDRWKIVDNLRRSLVPPAVFALLVAGWLFLPGQAWVWTTLALAAPGAYVVTPFLTGLSRGWARGALQNGFQRLKDHSGRWMLSLVFLLHDAMLSLDAVGRTLWRLFVSRQRLLEWTPAAQVADRVEARGGCAHVWQRMWIGPVVGAALVAVVALARPESLASATPVLLLWVLSPEIAWRIGRPRPLGVQSVDPESRTFLRLLARRTWLFFETFAGPDDHWLTPDNFQESPRPEIAHRTSPSNVGMLFLSSLAAWDLGYISSSDLAVRVRNTLTTLEGLERYRGHLLNWYDTRSLSPLEPRYVSTVDSGNLAVSLVALKEGCREAAAKPAVRVEVWDGLVDLLLLLDETGARLSGPPIGALRAYIQALVARVRIPRAHGGPWDTALHDLLAEDRAELDRLVAAVAAQTHAPSTVLREMRTWLERTHHHLRAMRRDMETLSPWSGVLGAPPPGREGLARRFAQLLPSNMSLEGVSQRCAQARDLAAAAAPHLAADAAASQWLRTLVDSLDRGAAGAAALRAALLSVADRAEAFALAMDFRLLYDAEPKHFRIGYNVTADRMDPHHYDLLASEARLASLFAIAKRDVPLEHWFHLGRPLTRVDDRLALISWGGSMFEYLMPPLLLRSHPGVLLAESERVAVDAQRAFARDAGIPWGVSESAFAALDANRHYRYQAFGVPSLALRRGLEHDRVVAPYATALALPVRTREAVSNLRTLERLGLRGLYGLFEAGDFTPERRVRHARVSLVRSWMAHHQGMILSAIDNTLSNQALVQRFHRDRRVRAIELVLQERVPRGLPTERARSAGRAEPAPRRAAPAQLTAWQPGGPLSTPRVHLLGNGRLSSWISDAGSGGLHWHDQHLTRWLPDSTRDDCGVWMYVLDEESGALWSAGRQPTGAVPDEASVLFHAHLAEFHRRDHGIALRMEVAVSAVDDVDIRRVGLTNESERSRQLLFTSYGEVVLAGPLEDERHPAFSKLFVGSEWLPASNSLLFTRRPRHANEHPAVLLHTVVFEPASAAQVVGYETDRYLFLGRHGDLRRPQGALDALSGTTGWTLDPIFALQVRVIVEPGERVEFAFVTAAAGSHESVLEMADRYATPTALDLAIEDAATESAHEAQRLALEPSQLPPLQTLASLLLFSHSALRAPLAQRAANRLGQSRLWGLGISGDLPILLVRASDPHGDGFLATLVRAQELWHRRGLAVDLVVLGSGGSSYAEPMRERLFTLLREMGSHAPAGRRGSVHLLFADQIHEDELRLLECSARAILDDAKGDVARQLAAIGTDPAELPAFQPVDVPTDDAPTPDVPRPDRLQFDNGFGGFSPDGREYVIYRRPLEPTPAPWCNVIANNDFGCLVSEAGLGCTWAGSSGEHRLTPWTNDPVVDPQGEAIYLRDEETADVWTPTPTPAGGGACEIRHGAGYTQWTRQSRGFAQRLVVFVAPQEPVKIVRLQLRNLWSRPRRVTATYYTEWLLGALPSVAHPHLTCEWEPAGPALLAGNRWNADFADRVAFLTATRPPHGVTADRTEFIGREGDLRRPAALTRWGLSGRMEARTDWCGAYQVHLDVQPDGVAEVTFILGEGRNREHALELVQRWREPARIERAWSDTTDHWDRLLGTVTVRTPDAAVNLMLNRWLPYQILASRVLARAGFYQASGACGFRDQLQDHVALLHADPARVRAHILACAARQFEEGDVLHWWHPPANRGVRTRCSDDLLWLPWATARYVEASGDASILDEEIPFLHAPVLSPGEPDRYGSFDLSRDHRPLLEHCQRALERGVTHGAHGLPLIGAGDWNDGLDRVGARGEGESVWLAWFAITAMRDFAALCNKRGRVDLAEMWQRRARELSRTADAVAWDGEWYVRAFADDGRPWGSHTNDECRIDSIAQSWAVLSAAADPGRARRALEAVQRELVRDADGLIRLLWPPFNQTLREPGYIKAYPPGIRENGGQYTHAAAWLGFAFAAMGDGGRAADVLGLINPIAHATTRDAAMQYRTEPYVLAADIGSVAPHVGRGGWTWYTGAAAWTWRLGIEAILGLRLREGRLAVEPCLPPTWQGFDATIRGGKGTLAISVEASDAMEEASRREITVDGAASHEPDVAFPMDGSTRTVRVLVVGARK